MQIFKGFFFFFKFPSLLRGLGHRQIIPPSSVSRNYILDAKNLLFSLIYLHISKNLRTFATGFAKRLKQHGKIGHR